jgi:hypothetical protein
MRRHAVSSGAPEQATRGRSRGFTGRSAGVRFVGASCATACVALALAVPAFGAENSFDGTYTGERVLTAGDPAACVAKDAASSTIKGDELTFTHSAVKDYTIRFSPRADGAFVQLSTDINGEVVDIRGHIGAGVLDADVTSASCAHHWHLEKQH